METLEFLPLHIRKASLTKTGSSRYQVIRAGGEYVIVEADSAAEAMMKSGYTEATRIVNLEIEQESLAEGMLAPDTGESVPTRISHDEMAVPLFFHVEASEDSGVVEDFAEVSVAEMATWKPRPPFNPNPPSGSATAKTTAAPERAAPPAAAMPPAVPIAAPGSEPEIAPGPEAEPMAQEILPPLSPGETQGDIYEIAASASPSAPEKELTPEDVRRLLSEE